MRLEGGKVHVEAGDSFVSIAHELGIGFFDLMSANAEKQNSLLQPGMVLDLPEDYIEEAAETLTAHQANAQAIAGTSDRVDDLAAAVADVRESVAKFVDGVREMNAQSHELGEELRGELRKIEERLSALEQKANASPL